MSQPARECVVFEAGSLLPREWTQLASEGPVRTFNPGLLRDGPGWLLAYRIVGGDGLRRIGLCRLDRELRIVPGLQLPLSDQIRFRRPDSIVPVARQWFADPRLYRLGGRVFVYWNSGWHEPRNWQFLQELDPATLQPVGDARELVLKGMARQKLEKNWTFFEVGQPGAFFAIYSVTPHQVLRFSLEGDDEIAFEPAASCEWAIEDYPASHGGLRGGAPPVLHDGEFWSFCHSVHDDAEGYRYAATAYRFARELPFTPTWRPTRPLNMTEAASLQRRYDRLNPAVGKVIYPCGAAHDGTRWLISHGINDEQCAVSLLPDDDVAEILRPVAAAG